MTKKILLFLFITPYMVFAQSNCIKTKEAITSDFMLSTKIDVEKLWVYKNSLSRCGMVNDTLYVTILNRLIVHYNNELLHSEGGKIAVSLKKIIFSNNVSPNITNKLKIESLVNIAKSFAISQNYSDEIDIYEYILENFIDGHHNDRQISEVFVSLSSAYHQKGDYEKSIKCAERGIEFSKKNSTLSQMVSIILMKIKSLNSLGRVNEAIKVFESTLNILNGEPDKALVINVYRNKGYLMRNLGKSKEAIHAFEKAKKIKESLKQPTSLYDLDIGFVYYDLEKNYSKALYHYQLALNHTEDDYLKLRLFDNIGAVYWKRKDYIKALEIYQRGFTEFRDINFKKKDININPNTQVFKNLDLKDFFLTLAQDKALCWLDFAKSENNKKEYLQNALKTYELADKLIDYMRQEHTGTQSKYFWRNKTRSIYESAIETCFLLKDYQKAFYFFEKSRAVMLNDKINELGAKQTLSEEDQQQERKYIKDISELNANIEKEENQKKKSDLTTQLYTLQEQQERFIKSLETKNPAYYQIKYDTTTFQLKDIQSYLKKTQINSLVEYFMGDSTTYAIVITPENVALKKLSLKPENIQQFFDYCSKNITTKTELSAFLGFSSSLYQSLIAPLNLPNGRLIISQDGAFIPFEAISKSANSPQYLLYDYAISYTYSAQFLMKNQEKYGFLPNKKFLGAAPINFSSKLNTLQSSEQSLKSIEKNYTFGNLLINQAASRNAFLNEAGKYKIVQLYTHAFADSNDTEPKIYFADSALKVSDLNLTDHFKTNLLILSACKTGVGKVAKGEGVLSLARGFSMAGIRSTITSLWSVEDKDTYTLTELFHHYLNEGLPKDEALQQAKREFIVRTENTNPYSWAGFILIGDSSEISTTNWIIWALASFFIILLALIFAKKLHSKK